MRGKLWVVFLAAMAALVLAYALVADPTVQGFVWIVVAWAPVGAIVAGIRLHHPTARAPWWLMAAALGASAVAWVLTPASQELTGTDQRAAVADVLHIGGNLGLAAAALWFARLQTPEGDRNSVIDGVIVAVAVATVLWSAVIDPTALGANASMSGRVVFVVAPVLPAGIAAVCIRLWFTAGSRLPSARLLCAAWLLSFVGSLAWILLLQADAFAPGGWSDTLWAGALGCAGASGLHPSMAQLSRPTTATVRGESTGRLTVLGLALLATPAALLTTLDASPVHVVVPVAGAGLIALLALVRLTRLVHEREQARRELETRAAHQEVVARVGKAALDDRPVGALYAEAAQLVGQVVDDVQVAIRPHVAGAATDAQPGRTILSLPITSAGRTRATLDVVAEPGRALCAEERVFLGSVTTVLSGMTARRHAEEDLRRRALHDDLTGLPNRVLVLERLGAAVAQRDRGPVGVLFVDLDGFKPINDAHGHDAGDALLATIAARLPAVLREGDTVGRLAGDEFVVVAPDCDADGLAELAGRLLGTVVEPVTLGDADVSVGASIGGTLAGPDDRDPREVLRLADSAMYEAKGAGGGSVLTPAPSSPVGVRPR